MSRVTLHLPVIAASFLLLVCFETKLISEPEIQEVIQALVGLRR